MKLSKLTKNGIMQRILKDILCSRLSILFVHLLSKPKSYVFEKFALKIPQKNHYDIP